MFKIVFFFVPSALLLKITSFISLNAQHTTAAKPSGDKRFYLRSLD